MSRQCVLGIHEAHSLLEALLFNRAYRHHIFSDTMQNGRAELLNTTTAGETSDASMMAHTQAYGPLSGVVPF